MLNGMQVVTVSDSTKKDLLHYGFKDQAITIIPEGLHIDPVADLKDPKAADPTLLMHGSLRAMKRPLDVIKAFEHAKKEMPNLKLEISGAPSGKYGQKVIRYVQKSRFAADIKLHGRTTDDTKISLMRKCHFIVVTSVKEGWGLIVSEAASQGTPAIVRAFSPTSNYRRMRSHAYEFAKRLTFDVAYHEFKAVVTAVGTGR
jgi:glycosyltransferase involved in cell wall biosynthesis